MRYGGKPTTNFKRPLPRPGPDSWTGSLRRVTQGGSFTLQSGNWHLPQIKPSGLSRISFRDFPLPGSVTRYSGSTEALPLPGPALSHALLISSLADLDTFQRKGPHHYLLLLKKRSRMSMVTRTPTLSGASLWLFLPQ